MSSKIDRKQRIAAILSKRNPLHELMLTDRAKGII